MVVRMMMVGVVGVLGVPSDVPGNGAGSQTQAILPGSGLKSISSDRTNYTPYCARDLALAFS